MTQLIAVLFMAWGLAGCFPDHPTPLPSCAEINGVTAANGVLRVLKSEVPGVAIDSASWKSATTSPEMYTQTSVYYEAQLSATFTTPLSSFAVQFHSSRTSEDTLLIREGWLTPKRIDKNTEEVQLGRDSIRPGERRIAFQSISLRGTKPGPWGCPTSVQIVRFVEPERR